MAAEIQGSDIADKSAIEAPYQIKKGVDELIASITKLKELTKGADANIKMAKSVGEISKETQNLTTAQIELEKINKRIITEQAKLNDENIEAAKVLSDVKKQVKDKTSLGDKDAQSVRAQTSSVTQLAAALAKNRSAYEGLKTAQERNSEAGKKLLANIQAQDKELKKLRESQGKHQESVGNYAKGLEGLNNVSGGVITNLKNVGISLLQIVSSPITLGLAAIAGIFVALKESAESYYKSSLAGEEEFNKTKAARDAFFLSYESSWVNLGRVAAERIESMKNSWQAFLKLFQSDSFTATQDAQIRKSEEIADKEAMLSHEHRQDLLDDAQTEVEVNKLMEISRAKLAHTSQERIKALKDGNELLRKQEEGDIELAIKDLELQRDKVQLQSEANTTMATQFDRTKSILGLTQEEIKFIGVKREEIDKLAQLEVALSKIQSDAAAKRTSRLKLETTLIKEIQAEDEDALKLAAQMFRLNFKLQDDYQKSSIDSQRTYTEQQLDNLKTHGLDVSGLQKIVADRLIKQKQGEYAQQLEDEEEFQAALMQLKQQAFQTANDLANNFFDAELIRIDARKNALETAQAAELTAAGNNANAKASIESRYASQLKALDNEQRAVKRRQAIAQKTLAAFEIGVNTFLKASEAGFITPTAIAIYAAGALALASVLTKPIPAFKDGGITETPIVVAGEEGAERYETPGGRVGFTPNTATVMRFPIGTKITKHEDTMRDIAMASLGREASVDYGNRDMLNRLERLEAAQNIGTGKIVNAVKAGRTNFDRQGSMLYKWIELENGRRKRVRAKSMGS